MYIDMFFWNNNVYFVCLISVCLFISVCFHCLPEMVNKYEYITQRSAKTLVIIRVADSMLGIRMRKRDRESTKVHDSSREDMERQIEREKDAAAAATAPAAELQSNQFSHYVREQRTIADAVKSAMENTDQMLRPCSGGSEKRGAVGNGATENAGLEARHQTAGVENAGVENAGV